MKTQLAAVVFLLMGSCSYSQDYMDISHFSYPDKEFLEIYINANKIQRYIIYQTDLVDNQLKLREDEEIVTFLIWSNGRDEFIKMITSNKIFKSEEVKPAQLFSYKRIKSTGATLSEDRLKFVPPVLTPFNSEIVVYVDKDNKFFFELGATHYYDEDETKIIYRKELTRIIKSIINEKLLLFQIESDYKRPDID